jgi:hypothetical protein
MVKRKGNVNFEQSDGGTTVYYIPTNGNGAKKGAVTAFKKGFRMTVGMSDFPTSLPSVLSSSWLKSHSLTSNAGNPAYRTEAEAKQFRQLTYTCLQNMNTRSPETLDFPKKPCPAGIMVNVRFPTCWDGVNLDSPNHAEHVAYRTFLPRTALLGSSMIDLTDQTQRALAHSKVMAHALRPTQ